MFITDRDLLVLEPHVFRDAGFVGQRLLLGTANVSGTTMTLSGASFTSAGIAPGHVLLYESVPLEVLSVSSATGATVSLLRARATDPAIPPPSLGSKPLACWSFRPQAALMHSQVLRMLGIDPDGEPGLVTEASIVNPSSLVLAESLATLHLVYAAAAALSPSDSALSARAQMYRHRFDEERRLAVARIDLDGDGEADATRRLNTVQFVRA